MSHAYEVHCAKADWQVGPTEIEIANYDKHKIAYRLDVENFVNKLAKKSIRKKNFFTIATNVLCYDKATYGDRHAPADRDIYPPLEIAIAKWSLANAREPIESRVMDSRTWMINPGRPTHLSHSDARAHREHHKIDFDPDDIEQNQFIEPNLKTIIKDINSYLSPDRLVFSLNLQRIRQDLGALKWLNRKTEGSLKPIKILSMLDLYVVLIRYFNPDAGKIYGQGLATFRMDHCSNSYETRMLCVYHKTKCKKSEGECKNCAKALVQVQANIMIDDVVKFGKVFEDLPNATNKKSLETKTKLVEISTGH